jgi:hypothetical protein
VLIRYLCCAAFTKVLMGFAFLSLILFECWAAFVNYSYAASPEPYNYHGERVAQL